MSCGGGGACACGEGEIGSGSLLWLVARDGMLEVALCGAMLGLLGLK